MAEQVHVNGECHLRSGTGASGALESLGYSVDGAGIQFITHYEDVPADTGGGPAGVPVDVQYMGEEAIVKAQLVVYDEAVLAKLRRLADAVNEGELGTVGRLMGANGHLIRMLITSPSEALPWNFLTGYLKDAFEVKLATKRTAWDLTWRAIAYIGSGTAKGTVLYNRVTSG